MALLRLQCQLVIYYRVYQLFTTIPIDEEYKLYIHWLLLLKTVADDDCHISARLLDYIIVWLCLEFIFEAQIESDYV